jgi:hypothetical protein
MEIGMNWVMFAVSLVLVGAVFWMQRQVLRTVRTYAVTELEVIGHTRRLLEDLQERDPLIAEAVELGIVELAQQELILTELANGNYRSAARLGAARRRSGSS